jgi:quinol monooxygenase YgiN
MLLVHITWTVKPDDEAKLLDIVKGVWDKMKAAPECTYLNVFKSSEPGRIRVVEMWNVDDKLWIDNVSQLILQWSDSW